MLNKIAKIARFTADVVTISFAVKKLLEAKK